MFFCSIINSSSAFQISALEARLVTYESNVMNLKQEVEEQEASLIKLKQEVSIVQ
jgi:hypothetical protein